METITTLLAIVLYLVIGAAVTGVMTAYTGDQSDDPEFVIMVPVLVAAWPFTVAIFLGVILIVLPLVFVGRGTYNLAKRFRK
jgi:fructose-specific phosphotransferase system IIC component